MVDVPETLMGEELEVALVVAGEVSIPACRRLLERAAAHAEWVTDISSNALWTTAGYKIYIDRDCLEMCTPECSSPDQLVAYSFAARERLLDLVLSHSASCRPTDRLTPFVVSAHENYSSVLQAQELMGMVVHLSSRSILVGGGGIWQGKYVWSPRILSRINCVVHGIDYGLLDSKQDAAEEGRCHILCGDPLLGSRYSQWLKYGSTCMALRALHADRTCFDFAIPISPLEAAKQIAVGDLDLTVRCRDGQDRTAIELQRTVLDTIKRTPATLPTWAPELLSHWQRLLDNLASGDYSAADQLEWALKLKAFDSGDYSMEETNEIDARFRLLGGIWNDMRQHGLLKSMDDVPGVSEQDIQIAGNVAPPTRALQRSQAVQYLYQQGVRSADIGWRRVCHGGRVIWEAAESEKPS